MENYNSKLLQFIKENKEDWETKLNEMKINTYWDDRFPGLVICKYMIDANFNNELCKEARGIIIDTINYEVVCRPFDKFFEYDDKFADEIDWDSAEVLEKLDGTMISLWYYKKEQRWVIATQRFISADDPLCLIPDKHMTFSDLFMEAIKHRKDFFYYLNPDLTYIFELVSPLNQVIIKYNKSRIFFLTSRDNKTGEEINEICHGGRLEHATSWLNLIYIPKKYNLTNLDSCIYYLSTINQTNGTVFSILHEGFVVVDKYSHRIKIKNLEWLMLYNAFSNGVFKANRIIPLLIDSKLDIESICKEMPYYETFLRYYQFKFVEFKNNLEKVIHAALYLYNKYNKNMKLLGPVFKQNKYYPYIFYAIKNPNCTTEDLIKTIDSKYLINEIKDYKYETTVKDLYNAINEILLES